MARLRMQGIAIAASLVLVGSPAPTTGAVSSCSGKAATIQGTSGDDVLRGTKGRDVIVAFGGDDQIKGRGGGDIVCAGAGNDVLIGGGGADKLVGGAGDDVLLGSAGNDRLLGGGGVDALLGAGGDDTYAGGGDLDLAAFLASPQGVRADLATGLAGGEGVDRLTGIEALVGSDHADQLLGDGNSNAMFSGKGADVLDGRGGNDFILLGLAPGPVVITLGNDSYTGGGRAYDIENVIGSPYDDVIHGDAGYNYLDGGEGDDFVDGIDGWDDCVAETQVGCRTYAGSDQPPAAPAAGLQGAATGLTAPQIDPHMVPPPTSRSANVAAQGTQYGYTNCPMLSSVALIGTNLNGYGFFASRSSQGFGGYFPWNYSTNLYYSGSSYWWQNANGSWNGPYDRWSNHQWVQDIGVNLTGYGWFYSWDTRQWYDLGACQGRGMHLGIFS